MLSLSNLLPLLFLLISVEALNRRSIDLIAAHSLISDSRLPQEVTPNSYILELEPEPTKGTFNGRVRINITWQESTDKITLHAHQDLEVFKIIVTQFAPDDETEKASSTPLPPTEIRVLKTERVPKKPLYIIHLERTAKRGAECEVDLTFTGKMFNDTSEGLFRGSYVDPQTKTQKWFAATHLRPNLARTVFPCFDEPAYKVPFDISIARHKNMLALSNMPLESTTPMKGKQDWVWDKFQQTPSMSTFSVGIVVSEFSNTDFNTTDEENNFSNFFYQKQMSQKKQNLKTILLVLINLLLIFFLVL